MTSSVDLRNIVEAALLAAGRPLSLDGLQGLFDEIECPTRKELRAVLETLTEEYAGRGIEVVEVASGWRIQVGKDCSPWVARLWDERPARYSRALMETLALIAYRQPITRGEIEDIRGVSVSTNIVKTLLEREWVRVVGQRDVPGKPSLFGTTREFLDYFGLKTLDDLPTLAELRDLDEINRELDLDDPGGTKSADAGGGSDAVADTQTQEDAVPRDPTDVTGDRTEVTVDAANTAESPDHPTAPAVDEPTEETAPERGLMDAASAARPTIDDDRDPGEVDETVYETEPAVDRINRP